MWGIWLNLYYTVNGMKNLENADARETHCINQSKVKAISIGKERV